MSEKKSVKEQVRLILHEHKGTYYSGQELADKIGVSRTAVWKAINNLRDDGIEIVGSTKNGYTMAADTDILDAAIIMEMLDDDAKSFYQVNCVRVTESTNEDCKKLGNEGAPEGTCFIAEQQTAGKGRRGRSFYSPQGTGLYLTILLRPKMAIEDAVLMTTVAAVAGAKACESVKESLGECGCDIKWVNDLFIDGRKISGILTEASLSMETGGLDYAVMGIGFNLTPPVDGWPEEIQQVVGSLYEADEYPAGTRNKLAAAFLNEYLKIYRTLPAVTYLDEYRKRQMVLGKTVDVIEADGSRRKAEAIDVDDRCQLIVRYEGEEGLTHLNSGEISVRL